MRSWKNACFNGAALIRARKFVQNGIVVEVVITLQRGRAHSSAEISAMNLNCRGFCIASTGPRSFERGNRVNIRMTPSEKRCFNGAALIRARKFVSARKTAMCLMSASTGPRSFERGNEAAAKKQFPHADKASTGPRSFERGNSVYTSRACRKRLVLQRGRAHSSAEMPPAPRKASPPPPASTGPRSFERGNDLRREFRLSSHQSASTGPRSFERGNNPDESKARQSYYQLQRGRAHSSAEIGSPHRARHLA
mgnify:CR=1 FL=1